MTKNTPQTTIYLDHAATTPLDSEVYEAMLSISGDIYANPSSMHSQGRRAFDILETARKTIATSLNAHAHEIIFTGSGTESDNMALYGVAHAYKKYGTHIIISAIEHKAVLASAHRLEKEGFEVTYLPVNNDGCINIQDCLAAIRPDTTLLSIIYANNEIGTVQPIAELSTALQTLRGNAPTPLLHTDACQAVGMLPVDVQTLNVDLLTVNSSKIYGPKGMGLLYIKDGVRLEPLIVGGSQESGKRAGTENIALAHGFAIALEKSCATHGATSKKLTQLRTHFINGLRSTCPDIILNGHPTKRLANNVHISIPYVEGESLVLLLDTYGICCATGSACSSTDLTPSHVLRAIGITDERIHGSLRFSLGKSTTKEEIDFTVASLSQCIHKLQSITAMPHMYNTNNA